MIHETAIIDPKAKLGVNVSVGAYSIVEADVEIGDNCSIASHVVIKGHTRIGCDNSIAQFCSVGEDPQDLKYSGSETWLEIGDRNTIREFCTLNRGTEHGGGLTKIGSDNFLMAYVHVAHDCIVGNHIILANNASLAGHVQIDDHAILGGLSGTHQFCRIGAYSFAAGGSMIAKDVPPFTKVSGYYAKPFGLNTEGLRRHGFSPGRINGIKRLYKVIYRQGLSLSEAVEQLQAEDECCTDAKLFLEIIESSKRGLVR